MTDFNENGCNDLELLDGMCDSVTAESFREEDTVIFTKRLKSQKYGGLIK